MYRLYTGLITIEGLTGSLWDGLYIALTDRGRAKHDFQWDGWPCVFEVKKEYWATRMIFIFILKWVHR